MQRIILYASQIQKCVGRRLRIYVEGGSNGSNACLLGNEPQSTEKKIVPQSRYKVTQLLFLFLCYLDLTRQSGKLYLVPSPIKITPALYSLN